MNNLIEEINELKNKNVLLELENVELKEKLKKYTNPERYKKYYQTHKEELKERHYEKSDYKPSKEQTKIYNKRYYEKKKLAKTNKVNTF